MHAWSVITPKCESEAWNSCGTAMVSCWTTCKKCPRICQDFFDWANSNGSL